MPYCIDNADTCLEAGTTGWAPTGVVPLELESAGVERVVGPLGEGDTVVGASPASDEVGAGRELAVLGVSARCVDGVTGAVVGTSTAAAVGAARSDDLVHPSSRIPGTNTRMATTTAMSPTGA
jgi:hypothetical protein